MIKKYFYINLVSSLSLCILVLFLVGYEGKKKEKAEVKKTQEAASVEKKVRLGQKEKDFSGLLDKLKQKNPFSKDHLATDKYKFTSGTLTLSGILYEAKRPLAIINEQVVAEGEMVGDKQVIKITHNEVILKDKDREYRLKTE
jgi:hypothetical protein